MNDRTSRPAKHNIKGLEMDVEQKLMDLECGIKLNEVGLE